MDEPFGIDEIEEVVKEFSDDKAPGPDGFNGKFLKNVGPLLNRIFVR